MKINLLKLQVYKLSKADVIRRYNKILLFSTCGVFGVLVIVLLVQFGYMAVKSSSLSEKVRVLQASYTQRSNEAATYSRVKDVLGQVSKIINSRYPYRNMIESVYKILPPGVVVSSASFTEKGRMSFSARADGVSKYQEFLTAFKKASQEKDFIYANVVQSRLSRDATGAYRIELLLETKQ